MGRIIGKAAAKVACAAAIIAAGLSGCNSTTAIYTLYRSSATVGPELRIHVATFDSSDGVEYNRENCNVARSLFQQQPGVTVRYWCEQGRYRS